MKDINEKMARNLYSGEFVAHNWDHIHRVHNFALRIAKNEQNVNYRILEAAVWLHDIARHLEFNNKCKCHAKTGAKMVISILSKLKFDKEDIKKISEAIRVHRYSNQDKANFIEAKILQDADRLDALGAISIARIFLFNGAKGNSIGSAVKRFYFKQIKLKPSTFNTKTGKAIAKHRYGFVLSFLKEIEGDLK